MMSDCAKCWETPCVCGHGYRDYNQAQRMTLAAAALGMSAEALTKALAQEIGQWTSKPPLEPGFYWLKLHHERQDISVCEIDADGDCTLLGWDVIEKPEAMAANGDEWWSVRIELPPK